jgi:ATP diphosphatase
MTTPQEPLARVRSLVGKLLDPADGCPWDREQTPLSLCEYILEECHEFIDAVRSGKPGHACDEMGDLLFLLVFAAHLFESRGQFSLADALNAGADKMTRRHPHVFGTAAFDSLEELHAAWAEIKKKEKAAAGEEEQGILASVPAGLPPLTKAYRLHSKAAQAGFTWDSDEEVERQVEAEWLELLDARAVGDAAAQEHELGDMFMALTELGRRMGIKAAHAADLAANRFRNRFQAMEKLARERGLDFAALSLDEKDALWNEVKAGESRA